MEKFSGILFDLYGTLIYTNKKRDSYGRLFQEMGLEGDSLAKARDRALTSSCDIAELASRLAPRNKIDFTKYEKSLADEVASARVYADVIPSLFYLKEKGIKLGLLSNLATPYKEPVFSLGLDKYFDSIVFSCDVGLKKPELCIFWLATERLHLHPKDVLMVGDSQKSDVLGAKSAGLDSKLLDRKNNGKDGLRDLRDVVRYIVSNKEK